ncbi:hypothetical protein TRFO_17138 [Tritrichomonas foetus]|uniref:Uncharacterized protein n=1 Tax=Tritrichomonas foetus TaxID=1144522 RepID=A0A1J4KSV5_9EUKA|nr:hypothetical protein TRFO_17138 [Tritrichomonas foetus]|eukprot:OHT12876.1 hypothetical protein TRFO_17138 [Tritrichomonas foetus]
MSEPIIDKIIGSSAIYRNNLSVHYKTGACAFSSHSFFSIVLPKEQQRYDLEVANDCREITALSFSNNGQHLVIGELGPNARLFVVTFSEQFDKILTKTEVRTKENGFSCVAMNSETGRLISVGNDEQPFLLLWDTTQPRPACIGCYHLPVKPTHLQISSDGNFAFVSGDKMLKFIDLSISSGSTPVILKSRNANIGQFKNSNFVAVGISVESPFTAYALTHNGVLCYFDTASIPFANRRGGSNKNLSPIVIIPNYLNCGETSSISLDKKIILVGTASGSVLAIKKDKSQHNIFGQFSSEGKGVVAIGIGERLTAAAYSDGHLMFWQRRINSQPILTLPSHRGPVCGLTVLPDCILSCGSDATVRVWKLMINKALIGKSSQEQISMRTITKLAPDYTHTLTGVRCIAARNDLVFAGDNSGNLHVMKLNKHNKLEEIKKIIECFPGVMCVAVQNEANTNSNMNPCVATGGGDGKARVYTINDHNLVLTVVKQYHSSPITGVAFTPNGFVTTSSNGIRFCNLPLGDVYSSTDTDDALLTLATIPSGKAVVTGGCDGCICLWLVKNGSLFRKHKLSPSSYPLAVAVDKAGLFIAVALSDGTTRLLDLFSGDTIYSFQSHAGIVTCITFHESDLLFSSFSGGIMRWTLPEAVHTAVAERFGQNQPILDILRVSDANTSSPDVNVRPSGTLMKGCEPEANWVFEKIENNQLRSDKPLAQDVDSLQEEEDEVEQAGFDAPRPSVEGEYEARVDDLVRQSFMRRNKEQLENSPSRSLSKSLSEEISTNIPNTSNLNTSQIDDTRHPSKHSSSSASKKRENKEEASQKIKPPKKKPELTRNKNSSHDKEATGNFSNININTTSDPFTVNSPRDNHSKQKEPMSKAEEMNRAALDLKTAYDNAKALLSQKPTCPEEIAAQTMVQNAVDMIKRDLCDTQLTSQIREYAQLILSAVDNL